MDTLIVIAACAAGSLAIILYWRGQHRLRIEADRQTLLPQQARPENRHLQ